MKKRITTFWLCLMMLISLIAVMAVVSAAETTEWTEISTVEQFNSQVPNGGNFKLTGDIIGAASTLFNYNLGAINLDLNGHTLQAGDVSSAGYFIRVNKGSELNLYDSVGGGKIIPSSETVAANFFLTNNGAFNMYGGEISGWNSVGKDLFRQVNGSASVTLQGGKISNCSSDAAFFNVSGGAFAVKNGFVLENNNLTNCSMFTDSSAVTINIDGGTFDNDLTTTFKSKDSKIVITGGIFVNDVSEYLADGYIMVDDSDNPSGAGYVVEDDTAFPTGVTKVVNIYTATGFGNITNGSGNIYYRLMADITGAQDVTNKVVDVVAYLDLNGKKLTAGVLSKHLIRFEGASACFNLYDTVGGGKILPSDGSKGKMCIVKKYGTFNMYGGEISGWDAGSNKVMTFPLCSEVNLYAGKITECITTSTLITTDGNNYIYDGFAFENNTFSTLLAEANNATLITVYGGTFNNTSEVNILFAESGSKLIVDGTDFEPTVNTTNEWDKICITKEMFGSKTIYEHNGDGHRADGAIKISGMALKLYDNISVGFKVPISYENPSLEIKLGETTLNAEKMQVGEYYVFVTDRISPQFAGDTISVTVKIGNTYGITYTVSIQDYCEKVLGSANASDIEKTLIADTLNYCAAAQIYESYNTNALVNINVGSYGTTSAPEINDTTSVHTTADGYTEQIKGISVGLNNGLRIRVTDPANLKLVVKDNTGIIETITNFEAATDGDGGYFAYFGGSSAAQLRKLYTFELVNITNNEVIETITNYSFETYAHSVSAGDVELTALVKAMMTYGDSAYAYAVSLPQ